MSGANMLVAWVANGQSVLSHRSVQGYSMPTSARAQGGFTSDTRVSRASNDMAVFSWSFPQQAAPGNAFVHIWAKNTATTPGADANSPISVHRGHGGFALDLTKPYNGEAPAVPTGVAALTDFRGSTSTTTSSSGSGSSSGGSSGSSGGIQPMRDLNMYNNRIWIAHMVFMLLAWLILVPAAVLTARFGRTLFKWFPAHRGLALAAFVSVTIGFFLAVGGIARAPPKHFSAKHMKVGLAIYILMFVQLVLGQTGHLVRRKTGSRITSFIHAPLGLFIFALAIWNCYLGFEIWSWWQVPRSATWVVAAWGILFAVVYLAGLLLFPKQQKAEEEQRGEKGNFRQGV